MNESQRPLPEFDSPPVIEVLLGVQFSPLASLSVAHLGLYWAALRQEYPNVEAKPALAPTTEEFGGQPGMNLQIGFRLSEAPDVRCWLIDASGTQLIQVQNDRFLRNWRKAKGSPEYPHYVNLKPLFSSEWERFCAFLQRERLGSPEVNQCEVTYVNHVEPGAELASYGEAHNVAALLSSPPPEGFLPSPEMVRLNTTYVIPEKMGRLHVDLQPVISTPAGKIVLQLTLTARGRPASSGVSDILEWFDLGHEWIVRGFAELTTAGMHRVWGRTA